MLGQSTVEVRARGGQPARTAIVELRSQRVDLDGPWRPGGMQPPLRDVGVMEIREVHAPEGVKEPLHWKLLTSLPCATRAQAQRVAGRYAARWWIEEYHKALKSGAGAEESQLERAGRLESLIAVLAVVSVRLLSAKMLARSRPESFEAAPALARKCWRSWKRKPARPKRVGTTETSSSPPRNWEVSSPANMTACPAGKPSGAAGNACSGCVKD